jgi:excisionase family DNA binding protein
MSSDGPVGRVLTVPEVAKLLRVTTGTVYRMARARTIPGAFRVKSSWRFSKEQLDLWTKTAKGAALATKKTARA